MKKLKILYSFVFCGSLLLLWGCKDNHTCSCSYREGTVDTITVTALPEMTLKKAEDACAEQLHVLMEDHIGVQCFVDLE